MHKKINILIIGVIISIGAIFSGCDIIDPPYTEEPTNGGNDTTEKIRKILLEDFTGFTCKNCPIAHRIVADLKKSFGEKLVVISIHAGGYAEPTSEHPYDFRTEAGTDLDDFFGVSAIGNPNGMVCRKEISGNRVIGPYQWESAISDLADLEPELLIDLSTAYNESTREISVDVEIEYLAEGSPNHHLSVFMIEDHVIEYQLDREADPPDVEDYDHRHVLRGSMNGTWGDQLKNSVIASGEKFNRSYSYTLTQDSDWEPDNMYIIAFVHDKENTYEVLQVQKEHLK